MNDIGKKKILIFGCVILVITFFVIFKNRDMKTSVIKNNPYNTYIQTNGGGASYEEYKEDGWPDSTRYTLNTTKSYCMGLDGEIVASNLSWSLETNTVVLNSLESANCYVYFDLK